MTIAVMIAVTMKKPKKITRYDIYQLVNAFNHLRNNDISTLKSIKIYLDPENIGE